MPEYTIGIDYGTLSGRAVLVDIDTGGELASSVYEYPHAVMETNLPDGTPLGHDWALQHPQDYLDVLYNTIPAVLKESGVNPGDVVGIGTDFTACTVLPALCDGTPLCFLDEHKSNPHAYVKLWKHHAAQSYANRLNSVASERNEPWLADYGGKISSEWSIPKLMQVADEAPGIYNAAQRWIEAADWIIWQLTGRETRNSCTAGYKAIYGGNGYPDKEFFRALNPVLENCAGKFGDSVNKLGEKAGILTSGMALKTGLKAGTAVAVGNVDAHVCVPGAGIYGGGQMLAIMGTSTCHMLMDTEYKQVPGICGVVKDGILPGLYGYEAGQSCVGDHFAWFSRIAKDSHEQLQKEAAKLKPGQSGLLALDWWNGNRSVLADADLTGMILGMSLQTGSAEIYRALIEATAYGTRMLIENYREHGIAVNEFIASGGISRKSPLVMQIYADVLNMPVRIAGAENGPAYGSALFAAVAAGAYENIGDAAKKLGKTLDVTYAPNADNAAVYDKLFAEYRALHDYFGRGANDIMKRLKKLKAEVI